MSRNSTTLLGAVARNDLREVERALDRGADVDARFDTDRYPSSRHVRPGMPIVMFAATGGKAWLPMLRLLVDRGAKLDAKGQAGERTLAMAIQGGVAQAVELLLDAGANANEVDRQGHGPLHFLVEFKSPALLRLALERGATPEIGRQSTQAIGRKPTITPLFHAVAGRKTEAVRVLLDAGADPNTGRSNQRSNLHPLGLAVQAKDRTIARLLLDAGADLGLLDATWRAGLLRLIPNAEALAEAGKAARKAAARAATPSKARRSTPAIEAKLAEKRNAVEVERKAAAAKKDAIAKAKKAAARVRERERIAAARAKAKKKASTKKASAKKASAKKVSAKKASAKKASAKKVSAKKTMAKKTGAKKVSAKKASAKKAGRAVRRRP